MTLARDVDYAKVQAAVFVTPETPPQTLTFPSAADRVRLRGFEPLPLTPPAWYPVPEARPTPDVVNVVQGKIAAVEFTLPMYLSVPPARGQPPPWHGLAANVFECVVDSAGRYVYAPRTAHSDTVTITRVADNVVHWHRGSKVSALSIEVSGTNEGVLTWKGLLGPGTWAGFMTTDVPIAPGPADELVTIRTRERPACVVGPEPTDLARVRIDSEEFDIVTVDYTTRTLVAYRARGGTEPVSHVAGTRMRPVAPLALPLPPSTSLPLTLGSVTFDGVPIRVVTMMVAHDDELEARLQDYGTAALTGYGRSAAGRTTRAAFTAYQRGAQPAVALAMLTRLSAGTTVGAELRAGDRTTGEVIVRLPRFQVREAAPGTAVGEFTLAFVGAGLASDAPGGDAFRLTVDAVESGGADAITYAQSGAVRAGRAGQPSAVGAGGARGRR